MQKRSRLSDDEIDELADRLINDAMVYVNQGRRAAAKANLQQLVNTLEEYNSEEAVGAVCLALQNLGEMAIQEGQAREALRIYDSALKKVEGRAEPTLKRLHLELLWCIGEATRASGDIRGAINIYREAEERFADFPEVRGNSTNNYPIQGYVAQCMLMRASQTGNLRQRQESIRIHRSPAHGGERDVSHRTDVSVHEELASGHQEFSRSY